MSNSIGENIRNLRVNLGINQGELAQQTGITQAMMSQIERGSKVPSLPLSAEIARVLKCSVDDLLANQTA